MNKEIAPIVWVGVGLLTTAAALHGAWTLSFPIREWHHGLFMLILSGASLGYGAGSWAAQQARDGRDHAIELAKKATESYRTLQDTVARSLRE